MNQFCIVQLGKFGDIANILPVAKKLHDEGNTPGFVVSMNYLPILRGVHYCRPDPVHFEPNRIDLALQYAQNKYKTVLNAQPYGKQYKYKGEIGVSFNELSWQSVGFGDQFHDRVGFPLVFDNRDKAREDFLIAQHVRGGRPILLLSVGCSRSSPFATHNAFSEAIKRKFGARFEIIDLCNVKCACIYDWLGLFERSTLLITADTAALHLATAVPSLKVIALVNDKPFLATTPRCNVVLKMNYGSVSEKMGDIYEAVFASLSTPNLPEKV